MTEPTRSRIPAWVAIAATVIAALALLVTIGNLGAIAAGDKRAIETRLQVLETAKTEQAQTLREIDRTLSKLNGTICSLESTTSGLEKQLARHMDNPRASLIQAPNDNTGKP